MGSSIAISRSVRHEAKRKRTSKAVAWLSKSVSGALLGLPKEFLKRVEKELPANPLMNDDDDPPPHFVIQSSQ
ncbi:MAG: hypothetical protein GY696_25605 [Gammaproteobacteria bacterium]|nr:hypothetical protein [Gammaproteobacteria bacterium]